jgi:lipoyl-dependent peroxiredoxin subunit D
MSLDALRNALPNYAADAKRNLGRLAAETLLSEQQKWGCLLACAHATGAADVVKAIAAEAAARLTPAAIAAAKSAASLMAMNAIYFRAVHLMRNTQYRTLRAGLRMNAKLTQGVAPMDFALWSLAVAAIHGCAACLDAHEDDVRQRGLSPSQVQSALRIAATVHAVAATIRAEAAFRTG